MGRNILRRKIIVLSLIYILVSSQGFGFPRMILQYPIGRSESPEGLQLRQKETLRSKNHPLIEYYISKYSQGEGKQWLERALNRAHPFADFIREELQRYGLPPEIFYLPVVESAYRSAATSRTGAAGLWQFMPDTGRMFHLQINQWVDERRDFYKATKAAVQTLLYNYKHTGDWLLTLAAYNGGITRVRRVMRQNNSSDFWYLLEKNALPQETLHYVPKLLAIAHIAENKRNYGLQINWEPPQEWSVIPLNQTIDLRLLAKRADIPLLSLQSWNSELYYPITPPVGNGYNLKVPAHLKDSVEEVLKKHADWLNFDIYYIKSGDTLSELAEYYGIRVSMLYQYNRNLHPQRLQIGQKILIPQLVKRPPYRRRDTKTSFTPVSGANYRVQPGDSLWSIARAFDTTVDELVELNNISPGKMIKAGWMLKVPTIDT